MPCKYSSEGIIPNLKSAELTCVGLYYQDDLHSEKI